MLKSFGGAHGQPDGAALHPEGSVLWLPSRAGRILKTSLYAHPGRVTSQQATAGRGR